MWLETSNRPWPLTVRSELVCFAQCWISGKPEHSGILRSGLSRPVVTCGSVILWMHLKYVQWMNWMSQWKRSDVWCWKSPHQHNWVIAVQLLKRQLMTDFMMPSIESRIYRYMPYLYNNCIFTWAHPLQWHVLLLHGKCIITKQTCINKSLF